MKSKANAKSQSVDYNQITLHSHFDKAGIHIDIRYFDYHVHEILILPNEYTAWRTMNRHQKEALIHTKINMQSLDNDVHLVTLVTHATVDVADSLIRKAQQDQAMRFTLTPRR